MTTTATPHKNGAQTPPPERPPTRLVPLADLVESPFNRRQRWGDLEGLAASFKSVGVLEDLLGRPDPGGSKRVELVFGHRRLRAAQLAQLHNVPVRVRAMTDAEVIEAQAVENLQRDDIHPLEEAETFQLLMEKASATPADLAVRVGKSLAFVYGRLKLLELDEHVREAWGKDKVGDTVALMIARIPDHGLQRKCLKRLLDFRRDDEGPMPVAQARGIILRDYMLRMADATWDLKDQTLCPKAGSCFNCPKRTGNQRELFADVGKQDMCTDPTCWADKRAAHQSLMTHKLEEQGARVVKGTKHHEWSPVAPPDGYVPVALSNYDLVHGHKLWGKTNGAVLKAAGVERERVVMFDEASKVVELVGKNTVAKAVRALGGRSDRTGQSPDAQHRLQREIDIRTRLLFGTAIAAKASRTQLEDKHVRFLIALHAPYGSDAVAVRRGWELGKSNYPQRGKKFMAEVEKLRGAELRGLLMEVVAADGPHHGRDLGRIYRLDYAEIAKKAAAEVKAEKAARKAAKKGAGK